MYEPVRVFIVSKRLRGEDFRSWKATAALSAYSACEDCGAPKGFLCSGAEHSHSSCSKRFDRWIVLKERQRYEQLGIREHSGLPRDVEVAR